jgi:hypothetical protein
MSEMSIGGTSGSTKPSVGRTGVELRFHKYEEFKALSKEQLAELNAWRAKRDASKGGESPKKRARFGKGTKDGDGGSGGRKQVEKIAAAVAKKLANKKSDAETEDELKKYIMAVVAEARGDQASKTKASTSSTDAKPPPGATLLSSILKKAKRE